MSTYVWNGKALVDKATGQMQEYDPKAPVKMPQIMRDIPEYLSPVTELPITSRSQRREDLRRAGCVEGAPMSKERRQLAEEKDRKRTEAQRNRWKK